MDVARTVVSIMGLEDKETKDNSTQANMRKVMRIFAKTPVALAAFYRARKGKKVYLQRKIFLFLKTFFICVLVKLQLKKLPRLLMFR